MTPNSAESDLGANKLQEFYTDDEGKVRVMIAEAICMFFLLFIYYEVGVNNYSVARTQQERRPIMAPLAIGFGIVAVHLYLFKLDRCSVNAFRTLMAALYATFRDADDKDDIWEDMIFPLLGQAIAVGAAVLLQHLLRRKGFASDPDDKDSALRSNSMYAGQQGGDAVDIEP
jgi:glycerol uptake facilitator-like aquaporin